MTKISDRLKDRRDVLGYSQDALVSSGVSQRKLSYWESGQYPSAFDMLVLIAQRYDCSADYLLGLTDDPSPAGEASEIQVLHERLSESRQQDAIELLEMWLMSESDEFELEWLRTRLERHVEEGSIDALGPVVEDQVWEMEDDGDG